PAVAGWGGEVAEEPELHEVAHIPGVAILHSRSLWTGTPRCQGAPSRTSATSMPREIGGGADSDVDFLYHRGVGTSRSSEAFGGPGTTPVRIWCPAAGASGRAPAAGCRRCVPSIVWALIA